MMIFIENDVALLAKVHFNGVLRQNNHSFILLIFTHFTLADQVESSVYFPKRENKRSIHSILCSFYHQVLASRQIVNPFVKTFPSAENMA